jgi:amino-acid N-acetyltransferase
MASTTPSITKNGVPYKIRRGAFDDVETIFTLLRTHTVEVIPRSISDISKNIDRFLVCDIGKKIVGAVAWQILPEVGAPRDPSVEIISLAVATDYLRQGIGTALVRAVVEKIKKLHPHQIIALSFTPPFFQSLGFRVVPKQELIHKIYSGCINCTKYNSPFTCPEVALVLDEGSAIIKDAGPVSDKTDAM